MCMLQHLLGIVLVVQKKEISLLHPRNFLALNITF